MILKKVKSIIFYVTISAAGFFVIVPFLWMISSSLKTREALRTIPIRWIPLRPSLDAYKTILSSRNFDFGTALFNSLFLAVTMTTVSVLSAAMAAYIFAKVPFKGREKIFSLYLATMMIPGAVTMIPNYVILKYLGLLDTFSGLISPSVANAFGTFLLKQNMVMIDNSYLEAAVIDGATLIQIFWKVVLPMSKPALFTLVLFSFMGSWNSYLWPLIVLTKRSKQTLQVVLGTMSSQFGSYEHLLMAGAVITIIPILIVYIFTQRFVDKGLAVGGLK